MYIYIYIYVHTQIHSMIAQAKIEFARVPRPWHSSATPRRLGSLRHCSVVLWPELAARGVPPSRRLHFHADFTYAKVTRRGTGVCASELMLHH